MSIFEIQSIYTVVKYDINGCTDLMLNMQSGFLALVEIIYTAMLKDVRTISPSSKIYLIWCSYNIAKGNKKQKT